jgi:hypothetical protein
MKKLREARNEYLRELGIDFKSQNSRHRTHVYARNAFICASRGLFTTEIIGEVWRRDHSSVCYATKQHQINLKFSKEYGHYYEIAKRHLSKIHTPIVRKVALRDAQTLTYENRELKAQVKHLEYEIKHLSSLVEFYCNRYGKKD